MWVYFFSGENCKHCIEPKTLLEQIKTTHFEVCISTYDISDPLFKNFGLTKIPSLVVINDKGDMSKYEGKNNVMTELIRLSIVLKLSLTVEF